MTGLIEGQWYAYRVRAFNKLGTSRPCRATDEIQAVDARGSAPSVPSVLDPDLRSGAGIIIIQGFSQIRMAMDTIKTNILTENKICLG